MTEPVRTGLTLGRRQVTQLMVLAFAGAAAPAMGSTKVDDRPYAFKDAAEQLRGFMKLQSRTDEGYTNYLNEGVVYAAQPGRQSVPMYAYEGLLRFHTKISGPDLYDVTFIEAGTYLDLRTGERLDRYQNPVSGKTNTVDHIVEGPLGWRWTAETLTVKTPAPTLQRRVEWRHFGGQSWLYFDNMISAELPGGRRLNAAALAAYAGETSQLRDRARTSVSNTILVDSSINPWAPWLDMGDVPGRLANNIVGRKLGAMSEAPNRLTKYIASTHPSVLEGVEAWKAPG